MPKEKDVQFLPLIKETFSQVFEDYAFDLQNEAVWDGHGEYSVTAINGDIALIFYLSVLPQVYYCSLGIRVSGDLAKKATSNGKPRSIDVMVIANALDLDYKHPPMQIQTNEDLKRILEKEKECLLKYCQDILSGDVSNWSKVVSDLDKNK